MNKRWGRREGGREGGRERGRKGGRRRERESGGEGRREAFFIWHNVHVQYIHLLSPPLSHQILIQSVCGTVVPKLITEDIPLLHSLLQDIFHGVPYRRTEMAALRKEISSVYKEYHLIFEEGEQVTSHWVDKVGVA